MLQFPFFITPVADTTLIRYLNLTIENFGREQVDIYIRTTKPSLQVAFQGLFFLPPNVIFLGRSS